MLVASKSLYLVRQHNSKNSKLGKVSHYYIPFDVTNLTLLYVCPKSNHICQGQLLHLPRKVKVSLVLCIPEFLTVGKYCEYELKKQGKEF